MKILPDELYAALKKEESFRAVAYQDQTGHPTVGYGHNLASPITDGAASYILMDDVKLAEDDLDRYFGWTSSLDIIRYSSFVELVFNMGAATLLKFVNFLAAAQKGDWSTASEQLLNSHYHEQVGKRAERIAAQLREGKWQTALT